MNHNHSPEIAAMLAKYPPSLKGPIETDSEVSSPVHLSSHPLSILLTPPPPGSRLPAKPALLSTLLNRPNLSQLQNNPTAVLEVMDASSNTHEFLISVGPHKVGVLSGLFGKEKPSTVVEVDGYLGYSAILFAAAMKRCHAQSCSWFISQRTSMGMERIDCVCEVSRSLKNSQVLRGSLSN